MVPADEHDAARKRPLSVHFVNNVLAAAAGAVEDDPVLARDTLAHLGAYLTAVLRDPVPAVPVAEELDLVESYLALESARFPDRVHARIGRDGIPEGRVRGGCVQAQVQERVGARLEARPSACHVALRPSRGALVLDLADFPGGEHAERHLLELTG